MAVISKLKYTASWTQSEKQLVDYILANTRESMGMSSKELAQQSYTSVSTVYRVCDKLGLNGFNDLKLQLAREVQNTHSDTTNYDVPFSKDSSDYEVMETMRALYTSTVDETMSLLDLGVLHKVVVLLDAARKINIYTALSNRQSADAFALKMRRMGRDVHVLTNVYDQEIEAMHSTPDTISILLSYAGRNRELKNTVKILQSKHSRIILISSLLDQTFEKYADYHIYLCSKEGRMPAKIASYSLMISSSYVFDVIYSVIFRRNYDDFMHEAENERMYLDYGSEMMSDGK